MLPEYQLTRSRRKTISLSVGKDLSVQVRAPLRMPLRDIEQFMGKHLDWIEKQRSQVEQRQKQALSPQQIQELRTAAGEVLPRRVQQFSAVMGVQPTGVKITAAATRWGSCSGRNSLCFSYRVMLLPPHLRDYIVVHELAHIRVKNHGAGFYAQVKAWLPDYKQRVAELKKLEKELPY